MADITQGLDRAAGATCSTGILSRSAPSSGFFNVIQESDGVLRRATLLIEYNHELYPSLVSRAVSSPYKL